MSPLQPSVHCKEDRRLTEVRTRRGEGKPFLPTGQHNFHRGGGSRTVAFNVLESEFLDVRMNNAEFRYSLRQVQHKFVALHQREPTANS